MPPATTRAVPPDGYEFWFPLLHSTPHTPMGVGCAGWCTVMLHTTSTSLCTVHCARWCPLYRPRLTLGPVPSHVGRARLPVASHLGRNDHACLPQLANPALARALRGVGFLSPPLNADNS